MRINTGAKELKIADIITRLFFGFLSHRVHLAECKPMLSCRRFLLDVFGIGLPRPWFSSQLLLKDVHPKVK